MRGLLEGVDTPEITFTIDTGKLGEIYIDTKSLEIPVQCLFPIKAGTGIMPQQPDGYSVLQVLRYNHLQIVLAMPKH